jgi:hypothetical protein
LIAPVRSTHPRSRLEPLELRAALNLVELLALPTQQDETGEVAAMRRQKPRLDALDLPVLLELRVVLDGLVEDLDRLALAAPDDLAPSDEQRLVRHYVSPPVM